MKSSAGCGPLAKTVALCALLFFSGSAGGMGCGHCDLKIATQSLPDGTVGTEYRSHIDSDCGGDTWAVVEGNLPPGIGLMNDGDLRGTPLLEGSYSFTVGVHDFSSGQNAFKGFLLTVNP
jgi:hypothetical protein